MLRSKRLLDSLFGEILLVNLNVLWLDESPFVNLDIVGGLRLQYLQDQNNYFLMKIRFHLVSREDAFWVRVLRSKYGWKGHLPVTIHRSNCSYLWRSISKVWPLFCENLIWSVGDGSTIQG